MNPWRRRLLIGCGAFLFIIALCFGGLTAWVVWQGSDRTLPLIAREMPSEFAAGDRIFKRRVVMRYPLGSSEQRMISDLKAQGFEVSQYNERGYWRGEGSISRVIFCGGKEWDVRWKAERGKIIEVLGVYGANCL